eukprot:6491458-Amphidinium_carterae.4
MNDVSSRRRYVVFRQRRTMTSENAPNCAGKRFQTVRVYLARTQPVRMYLELTYFKPGDLKKRTLKPLDSQVPKLTKRKPPLK